MDSANYMKVLINGTQITFCFSSILRKSAEFKVDDNQNDENPFQLNLLANISFYGAAIREKMSDISFCY